MLSPYSHRKMLLAAFAGLTLLGSGAQAFANGYPEKTVKMIVPFSPGGGTDVIGRVVSQKLTEKFGKQFVVENTPGAGGTIGAAAVAKAEPDGYSLLVYHIAMVSSPHVYKPLPYDPLKDFTPISQLSSAANMIAIYPGVPARNLKEFIEFAKARPGQVIFGSSGVGGSDHLAGELFARVAGFKMNHVPYKGGGPATIAAVSGEVHFTAGTVSQVVGMVKSGKLRPLAVMQKQRVATVPDVPTTPEAGLPDLDFSTWFGLWGPARMKSDVVATLNKAVREILTREDVRIALDKVGVEPAPSAPQAFDAMVKSEYARWDKILAEVFANVAR